MPDAPIDFGGVQRSWSFNFHSFLQQPFCADVLDEDIHLPLQGLDYWARVRWHQARGEFQKFGYFPGEVLNEQSPVLLLLRRRRTSTLLPIRCCATSVLRSNGT